MKTQLSFLLVAILTASCAPKTYLTQDVVQQNNLTSEDLGKIQFYNSRDIVLVRFSNSVKDKETENGTLKVSNKNAVQQIVIESGTPGVVVKEMGEGRLAVSFEPGDEKFLVFGLDRKTRHYQLLAKGWENGRGKVEYGDGVYLTNAGADQCRLLFKMKTVRDLQKEMRIAKGRKLEG